MPRIEESLLLPPLAATQPLENTISTPLKALIVAISAVVAAIFGFFLAGPAGAAIGALTLGAIALAVTHLLYSPKADQEVVVGQPQTANRSTSSTETPPPRSLTEQAVDAVRNSNPEPQVRQTPIVDPDALPKESRVPHLTEPQAAEGQTGEQELPPIQSQGSQPLEAQPVHLADPSIKLVAETGSAYLIQMLALRRGTVYNNPHALLGTVANKQVFGEENRLFVAHQSFLPVSLTDEQYTTMQTSPMGELTDPRVEWGSSLYIASDYDKPFNLEQDEANVYLLPVADNAPLDPIAEVGVRLEQCAHSLVRVLSYGPLNVEQRIAFKEHFNDKLMPIFASVETFIGQLDSFEGSKSLAGQMREYMLSASADEKQGMVQSMVYVQKEIQRMIALCDTILPLHLSPEERGLLNYPCQLVFASTGSLPRDQYNPAPHPNFLRIGRDLQRVYVPAEDIERIQAVFLHLKNENPLYEHIEVLDRATLLVPVS